MAEAVFPGPCQSAQVHLGLFKSKSFGTSGALVVCLGLHSTNLGSAGGQARSTDTRFWVSTAKRSVGPLTYRSATYTVDLPTDLTLGFLNFVAAQM